MSAVIGAIVALTVMGTGGSQTMRSWWQGGGEKTIVAVNRDNYAIASDQYDGLDPMSHAKRLISDAQAGLNSLPPAGAGEYAAWLNDLIQQGYSLQQYGLYNRQGSLIKATIRHVQAFEEKCRSYGLEFPHGG
jgi:hypothetical protein